MSGKLDVTMGVLVEVTAEELRQLQTSADVMQSCSKHPKPGWLYEYFRAHKAAQEVLGRAVRRSHAS